MKKIMLLGFIVSLITSCKEKKKESDKQSAITKNKVAVIDSLLVTDTTWGFIGKALNYSDLLVVYGAQNIKDERICGPECIDSINVTILYPNTKNEAIIYWQDSSYHKKIGMIECYSDSAAYHTSSGLKINSGITDLLKLNGQKINFYGFGWDYGGNIISYNSGNLEKSPVHFGLDIRYDETNVDNQLMGDIDLNTDMPAVKKMIDKIIIRSISLSFHTNNEY
jgi:hypothetical protein